jgi:hypothetical protein
MAARGESAMARSGARAESWRFVYVVQFPEWVKIGATSDLGKRMKSLPCGYGCSRSDIQLLKSWEVEQAYRVEWITKRLLWQHDHPGHERFKIAPDVAIAAVEEAIAKVKAGDYGVMPIDTYRRVRADRAEIKRRLDEFFHLS